MICSSCRTALLRSTRSSALRLSPRLALHSTPLTTTSRTTHHPTTFTTRLRQFSSTSPRRHAPEEPPSMSPAETSIADTLSAALSPTRVLVQDISGGCGSMYAIDVTAEAFRGLSMLKQQRLVNGALAEQIGAWHGVQIRTRVPDAA